MGRFIVYFQYIGTRYRGVVRTTGHSAAGERFIGVQNVLEGALDELRPVDPVRLHVSSRTDSGVHALCNTAHFDMVFRSKRTGEPRDIPPESITAAVNKNLQHQDIRIIKTLRVPDNFHSQHLAMRRTYLYRVALGCRQIHLPVFEKDRCWAIEQRLNIPLMEEASKRFLGTHDFTAFRSTSVGDDKKSPIKTINTIDFRTTHGFLDHHCNETARLDFLEVTFQSRSFLYRQIRRMTGALVAVGLGRIVPSDITTMLQSCDNSHMHGTTMAPAHGLYLKEVLYNENDLIFHNTPSEPSEDTSIT
nr:tRNA pseudouridine synthase-like 1 [Lytechinus pictus]